MEQPLGLLLKDSTRVMLQVVVVVGWPLLVFSCWFYS